MGDGALGGAGSEGFDFQNHLEDLLLPGLTLALSTSDSFELPLGCGCCIFFGRALA